mgnify:CR=1 FL=1
MERSADGPAIGLVLVLKLPAFARPQADHKIVCVANVDEVMEHKRRRVVFSVFQACTAADSVDTRQRGVGRGFEVDLERLKRPLLVRPSKPAKSERLLPWPTWQHRNREIAMQVLKTRLFDMERQKVHDERSASRAAQVGSGDRSERIRTYNFPQGRMTDHRIGLTLYKLDAVMAGDLDEIIDALIADHQATLLAEMNG